MYYKLNKEQADLIGEFYYSNDLLFSPYIDDGYNNYYISSQMYELLKDTIRFKKLDFTNIPTVLKIIFKDVSIPR